MAAADPKKSRRIRLRRDRADEPPGMRAALDRPLAALHPRAVNDSFAL
jgi:hypothetical protein